MTVSEALSPGVAHGCFELLELLEQTPMPLAAARTLGKLGVVSAERVTRCALLLGWAEVNEGGLLAPTLRGQSIRGMPRTEERLRSALLDLVQATDPPWVQGARFGRRHVLEYSPPEISQVCREAGLATGTSNDVVAFWDLLAARARGLHDVRLNETGRQGERLTLQHEDQRTGRRPQWIALDSNADGYDVLSQVSVTDAARLCIEVKASTLGLGGQFYLTRHEWDTAATLLQFVMHLWDLSKSTPRLAVVDIAQLAVHIPHDEGRGRWDSVCVPFSAFASAFAAV